MDLALFALWCFLVAVAGGYLAGTLPDTLLLLIIAFVLLQAGVDLLRRPIEPRAAAPGSSTSAPRW